jgi:hypothetical protein
MSTRSEFVFAILRGFVLSFAIAACAPITNPPAQTGTTNGTVDGNASGGGSTSEVLSAPGFSPASGNYIALTEIAISSATAGAVLRYTTDGSDPTADSTLYDTAKKPLLFTDSTWKAIVVKDGRTSPVASAAYTVAPYYPDFTLSLAVGMRWYFHYKYSHSVAYSLAGDTAYTTEKDFSFMLTESRIIDGIEFFRVAATGSMTSYVHWNWLAWQDRRLYGSIDGVAKTVLFDAMYGFWIGRCFFTSNSTDGLLSAKVSGEAMVISQGWQYSDNSTVYYPGLGTIYDPDPYSGYSNTTEKYKTDIGPYSYRYSHGSTTSTEASTDTYTITLTNTETGIDPSPFLYDSEVLDDRVSIVHLPASSGRIRANASSTSADAICYVESLGGGDPVVGAYSWKSAMAPIFEGRDLLHGAVETVYIDSPGGDCTIKVEGLPAGGCDLRVCFMKVSSGSTTGPWMASVPLQDASALDAGSTIQASFSGGDVDLFTSSLAFGKAIYAFAIPLSPELDLNIALMKPKAPGTDYSFVSSDRIRSESDHGAGVPEAMSYSKTTAISAFAQVWSDTNDDALPDPAGTYIFGWGSIP